MTSKIHYSLLSGWMTGDLWNLSLNSGEKNSLTVGLNFNIAHVSNAYISVCCINLDSIFTADSVKSCYFYPFIHADTKTKPSKMTTRFNSMCAFMKV